MVRVEEENYIISLATKIINTVNKTYYFDSSFCIEVAKFYSIYFLKNYNEEEINILSEEFLQLINNKEVVEKLCKEDEE